MITPRDRSPDSGSNFTDSNCDPRFSSCDTDSESESDSITVASVSSARTLKKKQKITGSLADHYAKKYGVGTDTESVSVSHESTPTYYPSSGTSNSSDEDTEFSHSAHDSSSASSTNTERDPAPESDKCAHLIFDENDNGIKGFVRFDAPKGGYRAGQTKIVSHMSGLSPGLHGFHIHEFGAENGCGNTGGHYNPEGVVHALPPTLPRKVGALGNIKAGHAGDGSYYRWDEQAKLHGETSIIGRSIIVH